MIFTIQDKLNNNFINFLRFILIKKRNFLDLDVSALMNSNQFKVNKKNNPRIILILKHPIKIKVVSTKVFSLYYYRNDGNKEKCPPCF